MKFYFFLNDHKNIAKNIQEERHFQQRHLTTQTKIKRALTN